MAGTPPTDELDLLLALTSPTAHQAEDGDDLTAKFDGEVDWTQLIKLALDHGVGGIVCQSLGQLPAQYVPAEIRSAADIHLNRARADNTRSLAVLRELLTEMEARGIAVFPFKGPTLALRLHDDLALRSFRDLDFVVHPDHIEAAMEFLFAKGYRESIPALGAAQMAHYRRYGGQAILFGETLPVEPHWEFVPRTLAISWDYLAMWRRLQPMSFDGWQTRYLSPEDLLIVLCLHGGKEAWAQLKWLADVAFFLQRFPQIDWDTVRARSERHGIGRMVRLGLLLARRLLGAELPSQVQAWIAQDTALDGLADYIFHRLFSDAPTEDLMYTVSGFHWRVRERYRDRLRYVVRTVCTPRNTHFASLSLPDKLFFLYYPFKLLHDYALLPIWQAVKSRSGQPS